MQTAAPHIRPSLSVREWIRASRERLAGVLFGPLGGRRRGSPRGDASFLFFSSDGRHDGSPSAGPFSAGSLSAEDLEAVRRRDPDALGRFFDTHFQRTYSLAARQLGDRVVAQDVTQEVFYRVLQAADRIDPQRDPVPWLVTITYNVCRDHWRRKSSRQGRQTVSLDEEATAFQIADGGPSPEENSESNRRAAAVQQALMQLPEDARAAILMHDYQGMQHEEIANVLGISPAAVRKRYSRALKELGEQLKRQFGDLAS